MDTQGKERHIYFVLFFTEDYYMAEKNKINLYARQNY